MRRGPIATRIYSWNPSTNTLRADESNGVQRLVKSVLGNGSVFTNQIDLAYSMLADAVGASEARDEYLDFARACFGPACCATCSSVGASMARRSSTGEADSTSA